jgi:hypothetical protein
MNHELDQEISGLGDVRRDDRAARFSLGDGGAARRGTGADRTGGEQFADGARITVGLTLIAGTAGV